jgi:hypothetical protein
VKRAAPTSMSYGLQDHATLLCPIPLQRQKTAGPGRSAEVKRPVFGMNTELARAQRPEYHCAPTRMGDVS